MNNDNHTRNKLPMQGTFNSVEWLWLAKIDSVN